MLDGVKEPMVFQLLNCLKPNTTAEDKVQFQ